MPIELRQKTDMDHNNFLGKMPWLQSFSPPNVRFPQSNESTWEAPDRVKNPAISRPLLGVLDELSSHLDLLSPLNQLQNYSLVWRFDNGGSTIDIQIHEGMAVQALNFGTRIGEKRNETAAPEFTGSTTRK